MRTRGALTFDRYGKSRTNNSRQTRQCYEPTRSRSSLLLAGARKRLNTSSQLKMWYCIWILELVVCPVSGCGATESLEELLVWRRHIDPAS